MTDASAPVVANRWSIYGYPAFLDQFEKLVREVDSLKERDPENWQKKNASKRLAAIIKLVKFVIPAGPADPKFRLGRALGDTRSVWFRAKFCQQHRLFFRFHSAKRIIVLIWVNDMDSIRAYESKKDAYATFKKMLISGIIPDDFEQLLNEAKASSERFEHSLRSGPSSE